MCNGIEMGVQVLIGNIKISKCKRVQLTKFQGWNSNRNRSSVYSASLFSSFLAGWGVDQISELGRDRDFRFFAIASVDCGGSTIIKFLDQIFLWVPEL